MPTVPGDEHAPATPTTSMTPPTATTTTATTAATPTATTTTAATTTTTPPATPTTTPPATPTTTTTAPPLSSPPPLASVVVDDDVAAAAPAVVELSKEEKAARDEEERAARKSKQLYESKINLVDPGMENIAHNCYVRPVIGGVGGLGLGYMFGMFFASTSYTGFEHTENMATRQKVIESWKTIHRASLSSAKGFAVVGIIYSGIECAIEKARAKSDLRNSVYAGCSTGALMAWTGGPVGMTIGCATFAAFSAAIDWYMMGRTWNQAAYTRKTQFRDSYD